MSDHSPSTAIPPGMRLPAPRRRHVLLCRAVCAFLLVAVTVLALGLTAGPAAAGAYPNLLDNNIAGSHSPLEIVNLYWDTNWNADNPGLPTTQTIDDFTRTMYSSQYLSGLSQYGVTFGSGFVGSFQADPGCGTAPASIGFGDLNSFVFCEKHTFNIAPQGDQSIIYMVYAPAASTWGSGCPSWDGFHALTLPSIIPPDAPQFFGFVLSACAGGGSLDGITRAASHEAVEAATDPTPLLGWIDNSLLDITDPNGILTGGEAADLCDPGTSTPVPGLGLAAPDHGPMLGGAQTYQVAYYWSNSAGQCVLPGDTDLAIGSVPDVTTTATSAAGAAVSFTVPTVSDEGGESPPVTCTDGFGAVKQPGDTFPVGSTTVICSATDPDDHPSFVETRFVVTVTDADLALIGVPAGITADATSPSGAAVSFTPPTASDEGGQSPPVLCDHNSGDTFPIGVTTVTCSANASDRDDANSPVSASFTVTVRDTDLALTGMPAGITLNATGPSGAAVTYTAPSAVDEDAASVSCDHPSGTTFPIGTTTVTCTATDADDLNSPVSASFSVTVRDTDLALTGMPAGITVNATGPGGAVVTYTAPTAVDEDTAAVSCDHPSGATFPIGTTTVTCTATDAADLNSPVSASFTVTVNGAQAQLQDLLAYVQGLPPGSSLGDKVRSALAYLAAGDTADACSTLAALINQANAQSGKHLTPTQAAFIVAAATRIRAVLDC